MTGRATAAALAAALALLGCTAEPGAAPLPPGGDAPTTSTTAPTASPSGPGATSGAGSVLARGPVRLTVRPQDAAQRAVLESYLGFFAAYADALGKADPRSAELRRRTTPTAFAAFARSIAGNAEDGITLRGPLELRPAVQKRGTASVTVILVDCLDASGQKFYDRSGSPTGDVGRRRPIQVQLLQTPSEVRYVVSSITGGPALACERSGS